MTDVNDAGDRYRFKPLLDRPTVEVMEDVAPDMQGDDSLALLQAIYRSADQPMHRRMRAAIAALPHERPKFAVIANAGTKDFANQLEAARRRCGTVRLPVQIDAQPNDAAIFQKVEVLKETD